MFYLVIIFTHVGYFIYLYENSSLNQILNIRPKLVFHVCHQLGKPLLLSSNIPVKTVWAAVSYYNTTTVYWLKDYFISVSKKTISSGKADKRG